MNPEKAGTVKVLKLEVYRIDGDHKAARKRWHGLADTVQRITNCIWETWLVWHVQNKTAAKQRAFLDKFSEWKKEKKGPKPKGDTQAVPPELSKLIYRTLADEFRDLNLRPLVLIQNAVLNKIKTRKASNGNLPGWVAILLHNESIPSSTHPQPIPFDKANAEILPPAIDGERFKLKLRIDRFDRPGKKTGGSNEDCIELLTNRRGIRQHAETLRKIVVGDYDFCGSSLQWHKAERKWYALICYRMPVGEREALDKNETAVLHPGRKDPWMIWHGDNWRYLGGRGDYVGTARRRLLTSRWARQENYRHAGSSTKGHGRGRALLAIEHLTQGWKNFVKTCNHNITSAAVKHCVRDGIGRLVYLQPAGDKRDSRFLSNAGKVPGRRDASSWDWHQVASMLAYKCKEAGIELEIRKCGDVQEKKAA